MINILVALVTTIFIELIVALILFRKQNKSQVIIVVTAVNLMTNPLINYLFIQSLFYFMNNDRLNQSETNELFLLIGLLLSEIVVILFEAYIYRKYLKVSLLKSIISSLILNVASFTIGHVIASHVLMIAHLIVFPRKPWGLPNTNVI